MKTEEYYVGLDIGTNSVGWAVTNTDYTLCRFKGKDMWGIRLFEEASTAEERRAFRTARRRNDRKKERQRITKLIFADEIAKKDDEFYLRLSESKYFLDDKKINTPNIYFNDENYKDHDYFKDYPTIYHLKKAFLENEDIKDIRLLYLVVNHYMKNRGHFLMPYLNAEDTMAFEPAFYALSEYLNDEYELEFSIDDINKFQNVLKDPALGKSDKGKSLAELAGTKNKQLKSILKMLSGSKVNLADILEPEIDSDMIELLKDAEIKSISLEEDLEEKEDIIEQELGERIELLKRIEALYDWAVLAEILDGEKYISYAKVKKYEEHKDDLKKLKYIIRTYLPEKYNEFFDSNKTSNNYAAYIGMTRINGKKLPIKKTCQQDEFCKSVRKLLENIEELKPEDREIFEELREKSENNRLMPKQISKDNGVIPYQVNEAELKRILANATKNFNFLLEKDEIGFTNKEKLEKTFSFRIPYYVGPLIKHNDKDIAWIVRDYSKKITPWNFDEVVDKKASAEKFITRMTNQCTYLINEDVIPKNSLVYSKYMVLNELNNLKIDGKGITVELKQKIYNDLFCSKKRVTNKALRNYLESVTDFNAKKNEISGIDGDFKASLKSYQDFKEILGDGFNEEMVEQLILWLVLFGDDRSILKSAIEDKYSDELTKDQIKSIMKLKYTGWGRLSSKLLTGIYSADYKENTGEAYSIIDFLWNTNENFIEIIYKYDFKRVIDSENKIDRDATLDELVENLALSPGVKRPVLQSAKIVDEIAKIKKQAPKKIFVEMARGKTDQGRTISRKTALMDLYKVCKKEESELYNMLQKETDASLRKDALYLYYTQFGKSMYSGKRIPIESINDKNICDIDHIYPQSKIKDDSLDNRVLVFRTENAEKGNEYPLDENIRQDMYGFWKILKDKKLISKRKYERLIRSEPLTNEELSDFVARQLVETRQSTKAVANLLQNLYPEDKTEIVYVKAKLAADFRNGENITRDKNDKIEGKDRIKFVKSREINDYHHAKDAYLNIVVGNVYNTKITHNKANFVAALKDNKISINRLFDYEIKDTWIPGRDGTMKTVCKVMNKNSVLFTRRSFEQTGGFYDQMIVKKGSGQAPIKSSDKRLHDIENYGGYNKLLVAYFSAIEYGESDKRLRKLEAIPIINVNEYESNPLTFLERKGYLNPKIICQKVKYNTLVKYDDFYMHLSANTGRQIRLKSAVQLVLSKEETNDIKKIEKYLLRCQTGDRKELSKDDFEVGVFDFVSREKNINLYNVLVYKMLNTIYKHKYFKIGEDLDSVEKRDRFDALTIYQQCYTIMQIIKMIRCTAESGDLHYLSKNGSSDKQKGTLNISKNYYPSKLKEFKIINQSITGLFENEVDLLEGVEN